MGGKAPLYVFLWFVLFTSPNLLKTALNWPKRHWSPELDASGTSCTATFPVPGFQTSFFPAFLFPPDLAVEFVNPATSSPATCNPKIRWEFFAPPGKHGTNKQLLCLISLPPHLPPPPPKHLKLCFSQRCFISFFHRRNTSVPRKREYRTSARPGFFWVRFLPLTASHLVFLSWIYIIWFQRWWMQRF